MLISQLAKQSQFCPSNNKNDKNYGDRMNKIEDILKLWTLRKLTIKGKIRVVNILILPQILYLGSVMHMPLKCVEAFKICITNFIWNYKTAKVKYTSIINKIEYGGLEWQELGAKIKSLKAKWIRQIIDSEYTSPWKKYLVSKFDQDINEIPYCNMSENDYPTFKDAFYKDLFDTWAKIHFCQPDNFF